MVFKPTVYWYVQMISKLTLKSIVFRESGGSGRSRSLIRKKTTKIMGPPKDSSVLASLDIVHSWGSSSHSQTLLDQDSHVNFLDADYLLVPVGRHLSVRGVPGADVAGGNSNSNDGSDHDGGKNPNSNSNSIAENGEN